MRYRNNNQETDEEKVPNMWQQDMYREKGDKAMKQNFKTKHVSVLSIILVSCVVLAGIALAAGDKPPEEVIDKVSQDGYLAMRETGSARVAIIDGRLDQAKSLIEQAQAHLQDAKQNAPEITVTVKTEEKIGDKTIDSSKMTETSDYIPIDTSLTLAEDFVATPENTAKIKEANEHLRQGNHEKADEVLKEAGIDVSVTRFLMPLDFVTSQVDKASSLLKDHKYYEANLALKGALDSMITDTVLLYEPVPAQQSNS